MKNQRITEGFCRMISHNSEPLSAGSMNNLSSFVIRNWRMRLREGEFLEWETKPACVYDEDGKILIAVPMSMGLGPFGHSSSGEFVIYINGVFAIEINVVKYPTKWSRDGVCFYYEIKHKWTLPETMTAGLGYLLLPPGFIKETGIPLLIRIDNRIDKSARHQSGSERWIGVDDVFGFASSIRDFYYMDEGINEVFRPKDRHTWGVDKLYFGDLHAHSGRTEKMFEQGEKSFLQKGNCGIKDPLDYFNYAKYISRLDFYCQSDHHRNEQWGLTQEDWNYRLDLAKKFEDEEFAVLCGCEIVTDDAGHWNIYLREKEPKLPPPEQLPFETIKKLLKERYKKGSVMLIPHQFPTYVKSPVDWDAFDADLTFAAEIYSHWGSGEYYGNPLQYTGADVHKPAFIDNALQRGYRIGFIGSTDEHGAAPGDGITFYNPVGAGMACVWAPDLSRESIFDAIKKRRCYATTGARIALKFDVNNTPMGGVISRDQHKEKLEINIEVSAPDDIKEAVIIKNGKELKVLNGRGCTGRWTCYDTNVKDGRPDHYYLRVVLEDGETAWASPVWID